MVLIGGAPAPEYIATNLPDRRVVLEQTISLDPRRWDGLLRGHDLDSTADAMADEVLRGRDVDYRADVFSVGAGTISPERAELLFCASLAWGLGSKARRLDTRIRSYAEDREQALLHLVDAWAAVREGEAPRVCYEQLLHPNGRPLIPWFGSAFATKYLYFAAGPNSAPSCLILDAVVATALKRAAVWPGAPSNAWWSSTYEKYCSLLRDWAGELSTRGTAVSPDQIEMALFKYG